MIGNFAAHADFIPMGAAECKQKVRKGFQFNNLQTPNVSGTVPEPYEWNPDPLAASLVRGEKRRRRGERKGGERRGGENREERG